MPRDDMDIAALSPEQLEAISQIVKDKVKATDHSRSESYRKTLKTAFASMQDARSFKQGELVQWKPNLKNKRLPNYFSPAVVVEVLPDPITNAEPNPGSSYFREPLDLVIGILDEDEELVLLHVDSRRFDHFSVESHE